MRKALIKLIESWAYRCAHDWKKINTTNVFFSSADKFPYSTKITYRCTKCGQTDKISV